MNSAALQRSKEGAVALQAELTSPEQGLALQRPLTSAVALVAAQKTQNRISAISFTQSQTKLPQIFTKLKIKLMNTLHSSQASQILKSQDHLSQISKSTMNNPKPEIQANHKVKVLEIIPLLQISTLIQP